MSNAILASVQVQMNLYGYPLLLVFGDIGNIFILILFHRQRQNPCSIYLMGSAVANILYLTVGGLLKIFVNSFQDASVPALIICKLSIYTPGFFGQVTKTLLIFACIDCYMNTSRSARLRAFSTPKHAKYVICGTYIIWAIVSSHSLVGITTSYGQCIKFGWYTIFSGFYALLFVGVTPSLVLSIFGYLTLKNMKQLHRRIQPTEVDMSVTSNQRHHHHHHRSLKKRDHDLSVLVLAEAIIYIITTGPFTIISFELMITLFIFSVKSLSLLQAEVFVYNVALLLILLFSAMPFYTYMVVSTSFRRDFKQLIFNGYRAIMRRLTFN